MSKIKTHKGAKKRFKITKSGKVLRKKGYASHLLTKKSAKRKRTLGRVEVIEGKKAKKLREII